jgi:serine/threonine protein phosphatase 1
MSFLLQHLPRLETGRTWAVGDIHGHFERLERTLESAGFDPRRDRLISVGDLVDRGPRSHEVESWLDQPWLHAVRGNHEDMAIRHARGNPVDLESYVFHGGQWFVDLDKPDQRRLAHRFEQLPVALEVQTAAGPVGVVHADCTYTSWGEFCERLQSPLSGVRRSAMGGAMWSRLRIRSRDHSGVRGLRALIVGHEPLPDPVVLGNVHHIDTGGWLPDGRITLLDLETLLPVL